MCADNLLIKCSNLKKIYGEVTALKNISLEIKKGEFLTVFGPNGAGKTTLMKILCGLTRPTSGKAQVNNTKVTDIEVKKKVGVISHKSYLYENLTAFENLSFYGNLYSIKNPAKKAEELLKMVELDSRKDDFVLFFSRGMLQRLSIARALVADPEFIFLDEPFTGLDQLSKELFVKLLKKLHERGKTILMITHDISLGVESSSRVIILKKGKMVYDQPTTSINKETFKLIYSEKITQ